MSARIEAGRLSHVDLGKTVEVRRLNGALQTGKLLEVSHSADMQHVILRVGATCFGLSPHTLVTITGKES